MTKYNFQKYLDTEKEREKNNWQETKKISINMNGEWAIDTEGHCKSFR